MQRRVFLAGAAAAAVAASAVRAAEPGVTDGEIRLGHTGVLSGPLGVPVKVFLSGAQLAFDELNDQGGVAGRKLRVMSLDDELKPDKAVANYRALLDEHQVFAFFGCVGSGTTAAASTVLRESGAPLVSPYAVADSARAKTEGAAYYTRATLRREAEVLVQHLTTIGLTRIAVAHLDNPGGAEVLALVNEALGQHGLRTRASAAIAGDGRNAATAARTLLDGQPQAVIMYLGGALGAELMKAVWTAGGVTSFYGMSIVPGEVTAKVLGDKTRGLAISQVTPYPWGEVEPLLRRYQRTAAASKVPVGYLSLEGYLGGQVMVEALKRCGRDLTRTRLHGVLRNLKLRLAGMDVDFTSGQSNGSRFVELVQVSYDGRFVR
ncbi:ABC transporter substrate-binding protein [Schlegelella sp. S2-27]|uniref:ABC transporter substrate-binding protein n=1 Tax=Caldimonas mangrovi TaxID=2944811 RepID=A0ABT0YQ80_9BURK|nr:ABC transporter substrate-binding protein [Caldimonas mangrovi]MCM5680895.1 ABC transporter substrate-binding protein [Caldimonas mangrovi]